MAADTLPPARGASAPAAADPSAWMLMLRGGIAIAFGVLAILWPDLTLLALVGLFAAYALLGGVVSIATAIRLRHDEPRWWLPLLLGIVSVVAGVYAMLAPAVTVLVLLMAANAILTGALDIAMAIRMRRAVRDHWLLLLVGVAAILFGAAVIAAPAAGALAVVWLVSFYAIFTGVLLLSLGWRMRRGALHQPVPRAAADHR